MTDVVELQCAMLRAHVNKKDVARVLGITYNGLMKKIKNQSFFTAPEIMTLTRYLGLTPETRDAIFFATDVDKNDT